MPVTTGEAKRGRGRSLAVPAFPDDDGSADPSVRALLTAADSPIAVARSLRGVRLLSCVVAVAEEVADDGTDKSSHMALVSMVNMRGDRGLLAFTGTDSLTTWNPDARPVPALGRDVARAAIEDGATAVVLDVAGPHRLVLEGDALAVLADQLDLPRAEALVQAALAGLTADGWVRVDVVDARARDVDADVLVVLSGPGGGHPDGRSPEQLTERAVSVLAQQPDLARVVPGGLGVVAGA